MEVVDRSVRFKWGWRYDLGAWGLPTEIETAGQEILAAPIRLEIVPKEHPEPLHPIRPPSSTGFDGHVHS